MTSPVANATQEARAWRVFQSDWDSDGTVSVHLPADVAVNLLDLCGWTRNEREQWVSPNGATSWHVEEACQIALTAMQEGGAR